MNISRMYELADLLEQQDDLDGMEFEMSQFVGSRFERYPIGSIRKDLEMDHCGTAGCIAGWVCWKWGADDRIISMIYAQELLGLSNEQSWELFHNQRGFVHENPCSLHDITQQEAAAAVRRMADEERERLLIEEMASLGGIRFVPLDDPAEMMRVIDEEVAE